jgi:sulfur-oxidizing protein SoxB
MERREFLQMLLTAAAAGYVPGQAAAGVDSLYPLSTLYDLPAFGTLSLLHFTDSHAQLLPLYYREPSVHIGVGSIAHEPAYLTGKALFQHYGLDPQGPLAHALDAQNFSELAQRYGKVGGYAHLAALIRQLRASRPQSLLLDGGDSWQGSATALWSGAQDMLEASHLLGVDAMTGHWEFTLGEARVKERVEQGQAWGMEFLAQNVNTADFNDPVFKPRMTRVLNGVPVAVVGQAYPHVELAHPAGVRPSYRFGLQEAALQRQIDAARGEGAQVVVLLSHNGLETDFKMASRLRGVDVILGGHTHDALLRPLVVKNAGGQTLVTNAGSHGKFLSVLDLEVKGGRVVDYRYHLLPVFSHGLPAHEEMSQLIEKHRAPWIERLNEPLAITEELLYRRGNFNGTFDQLLLEALSQELDAPLAFSPGFRWGGSLLPGSVVTFEDVMNQTAITYPQTQVRTLTGAEIKAYLEDVADNLFNPNPYLQQGGDMVRTLGLSYECHINQPSGQRIHRLSHRGHLLEAQRPYKVAGWASMESAAGEPAWELLRRNLKHKKTIRNLKVEVPRLV